MKYDVLIVGAGPGGIFAAYELMNNDPEKKIAVFVSRPSSGKKKMSY
jgi:Thi4 family.